MTDSSNLTIFLDFVGKDCVLGLDTTVLDDNQYLTNLKGEPHDLI